MLLKTWLKKWRSMPVNQVIDSQFYQQFRMSTSPIIVVGMHRSGTTLLVRLLQQCGVMMGTDLGKNLEPHSFQGVNRLIFDRLGVGWRSLESLPSQDCLLAHYDRIHARAQREVEQKTLRQFMTLEQAEQFVLGNGQWGWKDPRNSLILPFWYRVFPNARIVHIYRDGRDVALSLMNRDLQEYGAAYTDSQRIQRFLADITLWEQYVIRAQDGVALFDIHHTLKYENLLANPTGELAKLFQVIGLPTERGIDEIAAVVDSSPLHRDRNRDYAWLKTTGFTSPLLSTLGYEV